MRKMRFNGVSLQETYIQQAIDESIKNCRDCIADAKSKSVSVNNLDEYIASETIKIRNLEQGKGIDSVAFRQHVYYLQTGEDVALLP